MDSSVDITPTPQVTVIPPPNLLMTFHGGLMVAGWLGAAMMGLVAARYYKQTFVGTKFLGHDIWFSFHQSQMMLTWLCTIAGAILMWIHVDGWFRTTVHSILGFITVVLTFFQPFLAILRPTPEHPNRVIFKFIHIFGGGIAFAVAMAAIFTGMEIETMQMPWWSFLILYASYGVFVGANLILTTLQFFSAKKRTPGVENLGDAPYSMLRIIFFIIYAIIIVSLAVALTNIIFLYYDD